MRLISGFILVFFLIAANASSAPNTFEPHAPLHHVTENDQAFPVIYGKKDDGFPDKVRLRGSITKVSFAWSCGMVHEGGVLELKLARTSPEYNREHIYVVAPCLLGWEGDEQYFGKEVCMTVNKMKAGEMCHADYIRNTIDSKGVPFYCLLWQSGKIKEFLKQVQCKVEE